MHSKVIIASLVCALAASFNVGGKIANSSNKVAADTKGTVSCAPNDEQNYFELNSDDGRGGETIEANLHYEGSINNFRLLYKSSALQVTTNGYHASIVAPTSSGDYYATFSYTTNGRTCIRTIYVYSNGTYYGASAFSKHDARSKFFVNHNSTYYLPSNNYYEAYEMYSYSSETIDAEINFANFVYSGSNDISASVSSSTASSDNVRLRVIAKWYEPNGSTSHPLVGIGTNFVTTNGTILNAGNGFQCTDDQGYYTLTLSKQEASNYLRKDIQIKMNACTAATSVEGYQQRLYTYIRSEKNYTSSTYQQNLSNYSYIYYYINVYPSRSDRAAAFEIANAELPTYEYIQAFTNGVDHVRTKYPSHSTEYRDYPWYQHIIDVQKEDYSNWDLLSHEYAHYAEEMLSIGHYFSFSTRMPHTVHENLINRYGSYDGKSLAYHEGLATYIGLASQLYYKSRHSSFTAPNFGDLVYSDPYRGLSVNYSVFAPGKSGSNTITIEGVESAVTSTMIKLLDSASRNGDNIALGHQKMWNAILYAGTSDFSGFLDIVKNQNQNRLVDIEYLLCLERNQCQPVTPNSKAEWTVMLYMYSADLPAGTNIGEILSVGNQPSNVNVIIETDLPYSYTMDYQLPEGDFLYRYHVRNQKLYLDQIIQRTNMGYESTFESFLRWGFTYYPANKVGVIFYDHGRGVNGVCFDSYGLNYENGLTSSETSTAFKNVLGENPSNKLEFVGYDACLMQVQDVAEMNAPYFKYQVAAQEETSAATGWAYNGWLDNLYRGESTLSILTDIVNTFSHQSPNCSSPWEQCMSIINLSLMNSYLSAVNDLANAISPVVALDYGRFKSFCTNRSWYAGKADNSESAPYALADAVDFLTDMLQDDVYSQFSDEILRVLMFFPDLEEYYWDENHYFTCDVYPEELVVYTNALPGKYGSSSHGLSVHFCFNEFGQIYPAQDTHFTSWRDLFMEPGVASVFTWQPAQSHINPSQRKWFRFVAPVAGTYYFESESSIDTYVDLYNEKLSDNTTQASVDHNDNGGVGNNFKIGINLAENQKIYLRVRGCSANTNGDFTVFVECAPTHTHSYTQCSYLNSGFHTKTCVCGESITEEHSFDVYYPYGHGHNDMIHCTTCGANVEIIPINQAQYSGSIQDGDATWYMFETSLAGTFAFETLGNCDTDVDLYIGEVPQGNPLPGDWDDAGQGYNFRATCELDAGQRVWLRVKGYNFEPVDQYTLISTRV